jgi:hypothetical protein
VVKKIARRVPVVFLAFAVLILAVGLDLGFGLAPAVVFGEEQLNDVIDELLCLGLTAVGQVLACDLPWLAAVPSIGPLDAGMRRPGCIPLDERFRSSNHIRPPCRACRSRCGRPLPD